MLHATEFPHTIPVRYSFPFWPLFLSPFGVWLLFLYTFFVVSEFAVMCLGNTPSDVVWGLCLVSFLSFGGALSSFGFRLLGAGASVWLGGGIWVEARSLFATTPGLPPWRIVCWLVPYAKFRRPGGRSVLGPEWSDDDDPIPLSLPPGRQTGACYAVVRNLFYHRPRAGSYYTNFRYFK